MDGLKAVQQAVETGLETLRTTLVSSVAAITGDPAAREKIERLDEIAGKKDQLAELNAESKLLKGPGPKDISGQVGVANEILALEAEASADPSVTGQGLIELCEAFTAKLAELSAAIDDLAGRSAAAMEGISAEVEATKGEALVAGAEVGEDAAGALENSLTRMDASAADAFASIAASGLGASAQLQQAFGALDDVIFGSLGKLGPLFSRLFGGGLGKVLGSILGFAGGGAVQPGVPILVGERGPEVLIPSGPGRILNGHDSQRALGAGQPQLVVHQTNTFSTDVKNTVRAEVMNALPLATNIAAEKVMNALRGIRY